MKQLHVLPLRQQGKGNYNKGRDQGLLVKSEWTNNCKETSIRGVKMISLTQTYSLVGQKEHQWMATFEGTHNRYESEGCIYGQFPFAL